MDQSINPLPIVSPQPSFPKWPFIAFFSFLLGIASVLAYQKWQPARSNLVGQSPQAAFPSSSVDPTTGWKIYISENNFKVKYPPTLSAKEKSVIKNSSVVENFLLGDNIEIIVRSPKLAQEEILRNWSGYERLVLDGGMPVIKHDSTTSSIGGNPPYLIFTQYLFDGYDVNVFINFTESIEGDYINQKKIFDLILSTFKFTESQAETAGWQTYSNQEIGFSIKYPSGWREAKSTDWVGFGPKEVAGDVLFGINYYDKSTNSLNDIANTIGSQFPDRKETITGNKIIVTTPSISDWYSETIIYETPKWYIAISNGAVKNENLPFDRGVPAGFTFEKFYSTFKLTN